MKRDTVKPHKPKEPTEENKKTIKEMHTSFKKGDLDAFKKWFHKAQT